MLRIVMFISTMLVVSNCHWGFGCEWTYADISVQDRFWIQCSQKSNREVLFLRVVQFRVIIRMSQQS